MLVGQDKEEKKIPKNNKAKSLQKKLDKCKADNDYLMQIIEESRVHFTKINENVTLTRKLYAEITDVVKNLQSKDKKEEHILPNSPFTTSTTRHESVNISENVKKSIDKDMINIPIKKLEEIEASFSEMSKNFNLLTIKYKMIKQENEAAETSLMNTKQEITNFSAKYKALSSKLPEYENNFNKLKEINKFMVDTCLSLYANSEESPQNNVPTYKSHSISIEESFIEDRQGNIYNEPMPSFLRFMIN